MGFRGASIGVSFANVGMQHNPNVDSAPADTVVHPTTNVNFQNGGVGSRGGTAKVNAVAGYGGSKILGAFDFRKSDGSTQYQIVYAADGKIYRDATTVIASGLATGAIPSFVQVDDVLYFCNGSDAPLQGDPSSGSLGAFTNPAVDWATEAPFQLLLLENGVNRRLVALTSTQVFFSKDNDLDEFVTDVVSFTVSVVGGLTAGAMYGNRLIVFGRDEAKIFDTSNADASSWGYYPAPWRGGAAHFRVVVPLENDILVMTEDASIYSIAAVQSYNDYRKADLTKPAYINRWLQEHAKLASLSEFHACWDPMNRMIKFFLVRAGRTEVESSLNFYPDRPIDRAWSVHENRTGASGYNAACSFLVRVGVGNYQIYTGDYDGFLWKLEQTAKNDDGVAYTASFKTPHLNFNDPRRSKRFVRGFLVLEPKGDFNLGIKIWVDGDYKGATTVSMAGTGAVLGSFTLGTDVLGGRSMLKKVFELKCRGERLQLEFYNSGLNQPFFVSQLLVDFIPLGARPE